MTGPLGRVLIMMGIILIIVGLAFLFADKIPFLGKLPGDIYIKRERFTVYFPIATSLIISIILTIIFWLFKK
ncbi:MAG: DUF2905 domain-containing protein [Smithella sp.]